MAVCWPFAATTAALSPAALVAWSEVFGAVEQEGMTGRESMSVPGYPIPVLACATRPAI